MAFQEFFRELQWLTFLGPEVSLSFQFYKSEVEMDSRSALLWSLSSPLPSPPTHFPIPLPRY